MSEQIKWELAVTGHQQATGNLAMFDRAVTSTGTNLSTFDRAVTNSGKNALNASRQVGRAGSAVSAFGTVIGSAVPQVGMFSSVLGTAGSSVGALTGLLGGPMGLAAGGLVAVVGLAARAFSEASDEAGKLEGKIGGVHKSFSDFLSDIRAERSKAHTEQMIDMDLDPVAMEARRRERQQELDNVNASLMALTDDMPNVNQLASILTQKRIRLQAEVLDLENRINASTEEGVKIQEDLVAGEEALADMKAKEDANEAARNAAVKRAQDEIRADLEQRAELARMINEEEQGRIAMNERIEEERWDREWEAAQQRKADLLALEEEHRAEMIRLAEEEEAERNRILAESIREREAMERQHASMVAGVSGDLIAAMVTGQHEMVGQMLASYGQQYMAKGFGYMLEGGILSLLGNPTGPALVAQGGAMAAFGATLAGGGAALGGFDQPQTSGLGGGAGGVRQMGEFGQDRSAMQPSNETVVVNVQMLEPSESAGLAIAQSVGRARRTHGDSVVQDLR